MKKPISRTSLDLGISLLIALLVVILNLAYNFSRPLRARLTSPDGFPYVELTVNLLFCWLGGMLWLAFHRWRIEYRKRIELDDLISSISPDALLEIDADDKILMGNRSVERLFGYKPEELTGHGTEGLYTGYVPRGRPGPGLIYESLTRDGFSIGEAQGHCRDGKQIPLEVIAGRLSRHGCAVVLLRDISERVMHEHERVKQLEYIELRKKVDSLSSFAAGLAHEFNNLLMGISGNTELALMDMEHSHPVSDNLRTIQGITRRAAGLCRFLMTSAGSGSRPFKTIKICELVKKAAPAIAAGLRANIALQTDVDPVCKPIRGDSEEIREMLQRLVDNAAEAIKDKNGVIVISCSTKHYSREQLQDNYLHDTCPAGEYACIEVTDNGCGMDKIEQTRLFEPFSPYLSQGRGLGLFMVLGVVRSHGGCLMVESRRRQGTTFRILLPAFDQSDLLKNSEKTFRKAHRGAVLVVDDEQIVCSVAVEILNRMGFNTYKANTGQDALQIFKKHQEEIKLVLLDLTMPEMSGDIICEKLRAESTSVKILLCSGYPEEEVQDQFGNLATDGFLQKPYTVRTLNASIKELLPPDPRAV